jgi:tyrosyl-tRNA synthetase
LAERLVRLYHSVEAGAAAREHFDRVFKAHELPEEMPEAEIPAEAIKDGRVWLPRLLTSTGLASSNGEARRLIEQGGVKLNHEVVKDAGLEVAAEQLAGAIIQVGRRRFLRILG